MIAPGLRDRIALVRNRIERAARAAGRNPASVQLVAVSKTRTAEEVREAYELGLRAFGENYVQELLAKREALGHLADLAWHFIGHLQSNKAKDIARCVAMVHTVDSARLATELGKRAAAAERSLDVLIQVNVGEEAQKSGCAAREVATVMDAVRAQPSLRLRGLMTVPPNVDDPAGAAPYFDALRETRDANGGAVALPELSMGMTHDLEVAIACGATIVRVGTAIFGERS